MKLSKAIWKTLRENPSDAEIASHQLMMRAGLIHKSAGGIYSYLPFAYRSVRKIENIIREELDKVGCQEILMTVVTPGDLWKETKRWDQMGDQMLKFNDRAGRDLCISPTNEEAVTDIFRNIVSSYKQLPLTVYQINTKFRDEIRPRFGLMRGREFTMKDAYSFHLDKASMDAIYDDLFKAYSAIFERLELKFTTVEADGGAMADGDSKTHEFQVIADSGEDTLIEAAEIGYAANIEKAQTFRNGLTFSKETEEIKEVETKGFATCADVAKHLDIPLEHTLKTLIYTATYGTKEVHYMVMILGDDEVNEVKLLNVLKANHLTVASEKTLEELNLPKGYMGPYQKDESISVLLDSAISLGHNYVVGANKTDYHLTGLNIERDLKKYKHVDLRLAKEGDLGPDKKSVVSCRKGIEVGHIFQLGDKYSKAMKAKVLDQNGKSVTPLMGCYGIGVTRTLAAAIEQSHDENGIIWPQSIAPYHVYFAVIGKSAEIKNLANSIYQELQDSGIEVLFDDRGMGPGPMFKDADLLGLPYRVVLGERDFNKDGMLEIKERKTGEVIKVSKDELCGKLKGLLS